MIESTFWQAQSLPSMKKWRDVVTINFGPLPNRYPDGASRSPILFTTTLAMPGSSVVLEELQSYA